MLRTLVTSTPLLAGILASSSLQMEESLVVATEPGALRIRWSEGTVRVVEDSDTGLMVTRRSRGPRAFGQVIHRQSEAAVNLTMACTFPLPCGGDIDVHVPEGMTVQVDLRAGEVLLQGLTGDVSVSVGNGRVQALGMASHQATLQAAAGDLDLRWIDTPARLQALTARGDVHLGVPAGHYDVKDGTGRVRLQGVVAVQAAESDLEVLALGGEAVVQGH